MDFLRSYEAQMNAGLKLGYLPEFRQQNFNKIQMEKNELEIHNFLKIKKKNASKVAKPRKKRKKTAIINPESDKKESLSKATNGNTLTQEENKTLCAQPKFPPFIL